MSTEMFSGQTNSRRCYSSTHVPDWLSTSMSPLTW